MKRITLHYLHEDVQYSTLCKRDIRKEYNDESHYVLDPYETRMESFVLMKTQYRTETYVFTMCEECRNDPKLALYDLDRVEL